MNKQSWARALLMVAVLIVAGFSGSGARAQADAEGLKLNLRYDGKLLFIKVLSVDLNQQLTASGHASSARISSYGILDAFKHFNIDAVETGRVVHGAPQPGLFKHENHDGKRNRKVEVTWGPADVTTISEPEMTFMGDPPANRQQRLASVGYLTAAMRLTLAAEDGPCHGSEMIFNGKELSELGFSQPRQSSLTEAQRKLGLVNGVRCSAAFSEIAGYHRKKGKARNQGLDRPILVDFAQVGEGGPWVLAKLEAQTQLGPAVIELSRVQVQGRLPGAVIQAAKPD
jgi:hypothetical protein